MSLKCSFISQGSLTMADPLSPVKMIDKVKPCEICGDAGYEEVIVVCSRCNISRQHAYCMKMPQNNPKEPWLCDECQGIKKSISEQVPKKFHADKGSSFKDKRPSGNSKTKYIAPEEVKSLEFALQKKDVHSISKGCLAFNRPEGISSVPKKRAIVHSFSASNFKVKPDAHLGPRGRSQPQSHTRPQRSSKNQYWALSTEKRVSLVPARQNASRTPHASPRLPPRNVEVSNTQSKSRKGDPEEQGCEKSMDVVLPFEGPPNVDEVIKSGLHTFLPPVLCLPASSSGEKSSDVPLKLDRCLPNHPALCATWKGSFRIISDVMSVVSYNGFKAHPPFKVHRKAYEFSKQMPEALQVELVPRLKLCMDLFEDDLPCGLDIGLYFFPCSHRYDQNYKDLLERLHMHDVGLRSSINNVALLIFSSKHLHVNTQKINDRYFLWGVFLPYDDNNIASNVSTVADNVGIIDMDIDDSLTNATVVLKVENLPLEKNQYVDMEIDMLGGIDISGKVDEVSRRTVKNDCAQENNELSPGIASIQRTELAIKRLLQRDIPPGFTRSMSKSSRGAACVKIELKDEKPMISSTKIISPGDKCRSFVK